jgi:hypothetical protein
VKRGGQAGVFLIWCMNCRAETKATKIHGPLNRSRHLWWNECRECRSSYPTTPPLKARIDERRYEKASQQIRMF